MPNPAINRRLFSRSGNGLLNGLTHYYTGENLNDSVGSSNLTISGASLVAGQSGGINGNCFKNTTSGTPGAGQTCSNVADSITTPSVNDFSGGTGISFSIQLWVYVYNICQTQTEVFTKYNKAGVNVPEWAIQETANSVFRFQCGNAANNANTVLQFGSGNLSLGAWHHLVCGYDDPNQRLFTYLDGANFATSAITGTLTGTGAAIELFNAALRNFDEYQGFLDEAGFWYKRVLQQADVTRLYNGGAGLPFAALTH